MRHDVPRSGAVAAQSNSNLADQLERITPRFDELTQRVRLGVVSSNDYNVLEEHAQGIARDLPARDSRFLQRHVWIEAEGESLFLAVDAIFPPPRARAGLQNFQIEPVAVE